MKFRWTNKELKEKTDDEMIQSILMERISELNVESPLCRRLNSLCVKYANKNAKRK